MRRLNFALLPNMPRSPGVWVRRLLLLFMGSVRWGVGGRGGDDPSLEEEEEEEEEGGIVLRKGREEVMNQRSSW